MSSLNFRFRGYFTVKKRNSLDFLTFLSIFCPFKKFFFAICECRTELICRSRISATWRPISISNQREFMIAKQFFERNAKNRLRESLRIGQADRRKCFELELTCTSLDSRLFRAHSCWASAFEMHEMWYADWNALMASSKGVPSINGHHISKHNKSLAMQPNKEEREILIIACYFETFRSTSRNWLWERCVPKLPKF